MNPDDNFTNHELDRITDLNFNTEPSEIRQDLELLSIPAVRYLIARCDEIIAQQGELKAAAKRYLKELEE